MPRDTYNDWPRYVSVAERKANAAKTSKELAKQGNVLQPALVTSNRIATTFWGQAWCRHLEKFSDYANRLPRGRSYVRNGSVIHLEIKTGEIIALVGGSSVYQISINIEPLSADVWAALKAQCAGSISSALELLQGKLSTRTMQAVCDRDSGLFPLPDEIQLSCDCPDWATLCKHLAAVLYGVGARLDEAPELLFVLRGVNYEDLIGAELNIDTQTTGDEITQDLSEIFGIEIDDSIDLDSVVSPVKKTKVKTSKAAMTEPGADGKSKEKSKRRRTQSASMKKVSLQESSINISRGIRASHIEKLKKLHKISTSELAFLAGKSVTTVSSWENKAGVLKLQSASQKSLEKVFALSAAQIEKKLKRKRK